MPKVAEKTGSIQIQVNLFTWKLLKRAAVLDGRSGIVSWANARIYRLHNYQRDWLLQKTYEDYYGRFNREAKNVRLLSYEKKDLYKTTKADRYELHSQLNRMVRGLAKTQSMKHTEMLTRFLTYVACGETGTVIDEEIKSKTGI